MSITQLGKVWTVLSLFTLYYAINTWLVTQGGSPILSGKVLADAPAPAATFGLIICGVLLVVSGSIGVSYANRVRRSAAETVWTERVPLIGFDKIDLRSRDARLYQAGALVLFAGLPLLSLVHFWQRMMEGTLVKTGMPEGTPVGFWDFGATLAAGFNDPARLCTSMDGPKCVGGATYLPGVEPVVLIIITAIAGIVLALQAWAIFRSPAK